VPTSRTLDSCFPSSFVNQRPNISVRPLNTYANRILPERSRLSLQKGKEGASQPVVIGGGLELCWTGTCRRSLHHSPNRPDSPGTQSWHASRISRHSRHSGKPASEKCQPRTGSRDRDCDNPSLLVQMLSPAPAPPPQSPAESSSVSSPTTRRRGLSYLRSLSSRDHSSPANPTEPLRSSPRHFFARSTSYQDTKNLRAPEGRRRSVSHSRVREPAAASSVPLARVASEHGGEATAPETQPASESADANDMTRSRPSSSRRQTSEPMAGGAPMARTASGTGANGESTDAKTGLPTIRFFPHQDHNRLGRQSLNFTPISRTLPNEASIIRVGRYSEREGPPTANPSGPSDAAVGFKSKVVSRKHCEFCFVDGQWQIRDVASSSGTFLNHIRLSQPNSESRLYPIKDGDIVQLGIDFRGGEEMIFRCVKIRVECNRSWQKKPNMFNKQRQAQLRGLAKDQPAANANSGECSICLGNVMVSRQTLLTDSQR